MKKQKWKKGSIPSAWGGETSAIKKVIEEDSEKSLFSDLELAWQAVAKWWPIWGKKGLCSGNAKTVTPFGNGWLSPKDYTGLCVERHSPAVTVEKAGCAVYQEEIVEWRLGRSTKIDQSRKKRFNQFQLKLWKSDSIT